MWLRFEQLVNDLVWGNLLLPESEQLDGDSSMTLYFSTVSTRSVANAVLHLLPSMVESVLSFTNEKIDAMSVFMVKKLCDSQSTAAFISTSFAIWASNVSPMIHYVSGPALPAQRCYTRLIERQWSNSCSMSSTYSSIVVYNSFATKLLNADFTSLAITSPSPVQCVSVGRFLCSTFYSSMAAANARSLDYGLLSSLNTLSSATIGASSLAPFFAVWNHGA